MGAVLRLGTALGFGVVFLPLDVFFWADALEVWEGLTTTDDAVSKRSAKYGDTAFAATGIVDRVVDDVGVSGVELCVRGLATRLVELLEDPVGTGSRLRLGRGFCSSAGDTFTFTLTLTLFFLLPLTFRSSSFSCSLSGGFGLLGVTTARNGTAAEAVTVRVERRGRTAAVLDASSASLQDPDFAMKRLLGTVGIVSEWECVGVVRVYVNVNTGSYWWMLGLWNCRLGCLD